MRKVYTKTGDKGLTSIHGGKRVPKDDIRIEANGCLDELNAVIGIVRSLLPAQDAWQDLLHDVQKELMTVMSHVATPTDKTNPNPLGAAELTTRIEAEMDRMTESIQDPGYFLLPGGTVVAAQLHFARTVARRAERRLWTLNRQDAVDESILCLLNRLSDLFFVMARMENGRQGWSEEKWKEFAYKRKEKTVAKGIS
ncbi:MAG: cob(I)yrinic acid a,c-diamide adenosyltransferase [Bacteroides sp.]|nr:cob(I)yrinic acid a,c-diamide adenosyltransferase [Bacteroides sp.]